MKSTSENQILGLCKENSSLVCIKRGSANQCRVTDITKSSLVCEHWEETVVEVSAVLINTESRLEETENGVYYIDTVILCPCKNLITIKRNCLSNAKTLAFVFNVILDMIVITTQ